MSGWDTEKPYYKSYKEAFYNAFPNFEGEAWFKEIGYYPIAQEYLISDNLYEMAPGQLYVCSHNRHCEAYQWYLYEGESQSEINKRIESCISTNLRNIEENRNSIAFLEKRVELYKQYLSEQR